MLAGLGALVGVVSLAAVALIAGVIILALCVKTTITLSHYNIPRSTCTIVIEMHV